MPTVPNHVRLQDKHFAHGDLEVIFWAGSVFAGAIAEIGHDEIGDPGIWDTPGGPADELARLLDAMNRMQHAIRQARAWLRPIQQSAQRRAARAAGSR